ncbi:MAG TPA: response regulator [Opitutales bacterium]|jgi:two-component system cell cycle response regulator|nr:response regulator [Opitutales bacterium]
MKNRILIIEDNETNLELMLFLLQEFGYEPMTALDGEEGLTAIQQERPDLVLCDIQMPNLDGYELVKIVKADPELRSIPMVAVTALAMSGDKEKGLAAGFDSYINKPINPQSFVQEVQKMLGVAPSPVPEHIAAVAVSPVLPKKGTILVVDDLAANVKLMQSLLEPFGFHIITASGMTDAMALARKNQPDLIISDVCMHEGSGYHLCEAVKTDPRVKHIPIILLTSTFSDEGARQKGLALGAKRFLFRPIDSLTLLSEIEDCLPSGK